jgi:hypothetical protein
LVKLHLQANFHLMSNLRNWRLSQAALAESLDRRHIEMLFRSWMVDIADRVNYQTPYPLDQETASIVDSAIRNHVNTFQALEEKGHICDWLWDYVMEKGEKELPILSSRYEDGKKYPNVTPENGAEIWACFTDDVKFELFKSGKDSTCGLASMTEAEYNQNYQTIEKGVKELVQSGKVQAGWMIHLETIPIRFLRDVPMIEGKWIDQRLVELAERGTLIQAKDYQVQEDEVAHQLAMVSYIRPEGEKADPAELAVLRRKVQLFLKKYSGRTKQIDGGIYLHFEDYCSWRGRKVKGNLAKLVEEGLVTFSWNRWIAAQSNKKAMVADVTVGSLSTGVDSGDYYSCPQDVEAQLRRREELLADIRWWSFQPDRNQEMVQSWKKSVHYCLVELLAYRQAVEQIPKTYFAEQPVLFPDAARELAETISEAENTAKKFNSDFVEVFNYYQPLDQAAIRIMLIKK